IKRVFRWAVENELVAASAYQALAAVSGLQRGRSVARDTEPINADPTRRAAAFFIRVRQSLAGRLDRFAPLSRPRTPRGMNEQVSAWLSAMEGLPAVHHRVKRVAVLNSPAMGVISQQDGPRTLFYCGMNLSCRTTRPAVLGQRARIAAPD